MRVSLLLIFLLPSTSISASFSLTSPAFTPGGPIPSRYTCDGADVSPSLAWKGAPSHTASFALIVDDPDAPGRTFTHWLLFNLPSRIRSLSQGRVPAGAVQGTNDFGHVGYGGPCPPAGPPHHYRFTLYALKTPIHLSAGATKAQLLHALRGHVLATVRLVGTYRKR